VTEVVKGAVPRIDELELDNRDLLREEDLKVRPGLADVLVKRPEGPGFPPRSLLVRREVPDPGRQVKGERSGSVTGDGNGKRSGEAPSSHFEGRYRGRRPPVTMAEAELDRDERPQVQPSEIHDGGPGRIEPCKLHGSDRSLVRK
jgi:hypothetical protein